MAAARHRRKHSPGHLTGPITPHECWDKLQPGHDCELRALGHAQDWLGGALERGRLLRAFAAVLDPDELAGRLAHLERSRRDHLFAEFGIPPVRKVGRAVALQLCHMLQSPGADAFALAERLTSPVSVAMANCDALDLEGQLALARGGVQSMHAPYIRFEITGPDLGLLRVGLALQVEDDACLSAFAIGWLACHLVGADPEVVEVLQAAWAKLRAAHPELPEVLPMPRDLFIDEVDLAALGEHILTLGGAPAGGPAAGTAGTDPVDVAEDLLAVEDDEQPEPGPDVDEDAPDTVDDQHDETAAPAALDQDGAHVPDNAEADLAGDATMTVPQTVEQHAPADAGGPAGAVDETAAAAWVADPDGRAGALVALLSAAADQLRAGILPTDLDAVHRHVAELRGALGAWARDGLRPETLEQLRSAGAALDAQRHRLEALRRASSISGPARYDTELSDIRASTDPDGELADAVVALVGVIDWVAANPDDHDGKDDCNEMLSSTLPSKWSKVALPAVTGRLSLPAPEAAHAVTPVEAVTPVPLAPAAVAADAPVSPEPADDVAAAKAEPADAAVSEAEASEETAIDQPAPLKVPTVDATEAPEEAPAEVPAPDAAEVRLEAGDDLAALDDLAAELEQWIAGLDSADDAQLEADADDDDADEAGAPVPDVLESQPEPGPAALQPSAPVADPPAPVQTRQATVPGVGAPALTKPAPKVAPAAPAARVAARTAPASQNGAAAPAAASDADIDLDADLDVDAQLLDQDRAAVAAWLREAHGDMPGAVARRAAALSREVRGMVGRCASAFAEEISGVDVDDLPRREGDRLLLAASCMRAGLVAPSPEAAALLDALAPTLAGHQQTSYLATAFSKAAATGVLVLPVADTARASTKALEARHESSDAARRLLADGSARTLRFALATDVWAAWMRPDGMLGQALAIAADDDSARTDEVEDVLHRLSSPSRLNREIDHAANAQRRPSSRGDVLISRARERLIAMVSDATHVLQQWRDDVRAVAAVEQASPRSWQAGPLAELRNAVAEHQDGAQEELADSGAVALAGRVMAAACALLAGSTLEGEEPDPHRVLDAELLAVPDLPLVAGSLHPAVVPTPEQLRPLAAAAAGPPDWFEARSAVDDHQGTAAVLTILRDTHPGDASRLAAVREQRVTAAAGRRDARNQQLRARLDQALRHGLLDHTGWVELTGRLTALGTAGRVDFAAVNAGMDSVDADLGAKTDEMRQRARARLAGRVASDERVKAIEGALCARIDADDLTAFEEYLALAETGQDLPAAKDSVDHLAAFFPAFPEAAAAHPAGRRSTSSELVRALQSALNTGDGTPAGQGGSALESLLLDAGVSLRQLPDARQQNAANALGKWQSLGQGPGKGLPTTALHSILALAGLEFTDLEPLAEGRGKDRELYELRGVQGAGKAMLPAFGSAMSPAGDSLRVALVWKSPDPVTLIDAYSGQPSDRTVLVLYFGTLGPSERRALAAAARRRRRPPVLVLDDAALLYLACQPSHVRTAAVEILAAFSGITPFTPLLAGDVPQEMFYGRINEKRSVTDRNGSCFVFGGRQLGKSALLRAAARDFDNGGSHRAVVASIYSVGRSVEADRIWPLLWTRLCEAGILTGECPAVDAAGGFRAAVNAWMASDSDRQLLLLLDEADAFLDEDAATAEFAAVHAFRDLMEQSSRRVKVVFAGLHQTARFEQLGNQPLAHFGSPVSVGPLNPQAAYDLLTEPLRALGYRFADDAVPARVLALANNAPALVQLFGAALLERLMRTPLAEPGPPVTITAADVEAVWGDQALMADFRNRFEWTLNLDARYKVIAYHVAYKAMTDGPDVTLSAAELRTDCAQWWPTGFASCSTDEFRGLLAECVELGVLTKIADGYRLRSPNLLRLLGTADEMEQVLCEAAGLALPETFDAAAYRPQFGDGPARSPLSDAQSRELLSAGNQVFVVSGSSALRLERVPRALADAAAALTGTTVLGVGRTQTLAQLLDSVDAHSGHAVVIADLSRLSGASPVEAVSMAVDAVRRHARGTLSVVLLAGPSHVDTWLSAAGVTGGPLSEHARLVELSRLDHPALRLWMPEAALPFQDEGSRTRLLDVTGGWPILVDRVVDSVGQSLTSVEDALAAAGSRLDDPAAAAALLESVGVARGTTLGEAWRVVAEFGDATVTDIVELLEADSGPLSAQEVAAAGFGDLGGVVEALRILGALEPGEGGLARPQAALARASRALA